MNNSTLKFKSSAQNIRKQSTDEIRSIQIEEMKSQRRYEASVLIKSAYVEDGSIIPRHMNSAQLNSQLAHSVQHRAFAKKNKQKLSDGRSFRTVGSQERLVLPNTVGSTLLSHQKSQKDKMLELLRQQQHRYHLAGDPDQSFNFLKTGATAEPSSSGGSKSQVLSHVKTQ